MTAQDAAVLAEGEAATARAGSQWRVAAAAYGRAATAWLHVPHQEHRAFASFQLQAEALAAAGDSAAAAALLHAVPPRLAELPHCRVQAAAALEQASGYYATAGMVGAAVRALVAAASEFNVLQRHLDAEQAADKAAWMYALDLRDMWAAGTQFDAAFGFALAARRSFTVLHRHILHAGLAYLGHGTERGSVQLSARRRLAMAGWPDPFAGPLPAELGLLLDTSPAGLDAFRRSVRPLQPHEEALIQAMWSRLPALDARPAAATV